MIDVAPDIVRDLPSAVRFRDVNSFDLLVWGHSYHGNVAGKPTLLFRFNYTQFIQNWQVAAFEQFARDMALFLAGRRVAISAADDLTDFQIVARDLFEICLIIVAIFLLSKNEVAPATQLLEIVHARLSMTATGESGGFDTHQRRRIEELLVNAYEFMALQNHLKGDDSAANSILSRLRQLQPNNIAILDLSARVYYRLGNLTEAVRATDEIRRLDRRHPAVALNTAFFGILQRNYDRAGFWYDRARRSHRIKELDLLNAVSFLDEEYERKPGEHALLYGIGVVQGLDDPTGGAKELRRFVRKVRAVRVRAACAASVRAARLAAKIEAADDLPRSVKADWYAAYLEIRGEPPPSIT